MSGALSLMMVASGGFRVSCPNISASQPAGTPVSGTSTASMTGGLAPFSHNWTITSGSGFTLSNATSVTVTATKTGTSFGSVSGTIRDTVTDSLGRTSSDTASVFLENA